MTDYAWVILARMAVIIALGTFAVSIGVLVYKAIYFFSRMEKKLDVIMTSHMKFVESLTSMMNRMEKRGFNNGN